MSNSYIKVIYVCSWSSNMPAKRAYMFSLRTVWVHFSKEEMGMKKVLKSRLFILEVTDKFPFLTISA